MKTHLLCFCIIATILTGACTNSSGGSTTTKPTTPAPEAAGFDGVVYYCNASSTNVTVSGTLHIEATVAGALPGAAGKGTMSEDVPVSFAPNGTFASKSGFRTSDAYQQGTWKITKAQLHTSTGGNLSGLLPGLPLMVTLPGGLGSPVLNFSGGQCPLP